MFDIRVVGSETINVVEVSDDDEVVVSLCQTLVRSNRVRPNLAHHVGEGPKRMHDRVAIVVGGIVANVVRDLVSGLTAGQSYSNLVTNIAGMAVWLLFGLAALDQAQIAGDLVDTLTTAVFASLSAILIIKFGVGGIWAARDRFWPNVYDSISSQTSSTPPAPQRRTEG